MPVSLLRRAPAPLAPLVTRSYRRSVRAMPMSLRRRGRYLRKFGRLPDLRNPQRFTEKVTWRILNDRRPILRDTCDKARMKDHAERTAPAGVRVPQTRWQGTDLRELSDVPLPQHWVLKPNHRTGLVAFGSGTPDVEDLLRRTAGWLEATEWTEGGEWAYSAAEPGFIVEDRIGEPGQHLVDYKFFVFGGTARLVQTDTDRFGQHASRMYGPDWRPLGAFRRYPTGADVPRPGRLPDMVAAAEAIGAGFDFIRVDLYEHDGEIWFGELTPYPGSGLVELESAALDRRIGSWWRLPADV